MTNYRLRLLHISDLHEGEKMVNGKDTPALWRRRRVLGDEWKRNLDALSNEGAFDLVCFTGDAAYSGGSGSYGGVLEYEKAEAFFEKVLSRFSLGWDRFFIVPGNHDVDQSIEKAAWQDLRDKIPQVDESRVAEWLAGGKTPLGLEDRLRDAVLSRQGAYRAWLRKLKRVDLLPSADKHPNLGYCSTLRLPAHPFQIHIIGLDSAWLAGDKHDAGKLRVTDEQVRLVS